MERDLNPLRLDGKRILITGASGGIGRECAVLCGVLGGKVVAAGRDEIRLREALSAIPGLGHAHSCFDLSGADGIAGWLNRLSFDGKLDGLIHCAGVEQVKPIRAMSRDDMLSVVLTNSVVPFELVRAFRKREVSNRPCSIVLISSITSIVGAVGYSAYGASKAAVVGMAKRIRVNCISPGLIRTDMFTRLIKGYTEEQVSALESRYPLGFGAPEDVANAAAFLVSTASRWITGTNMIVDGGYTAQ
jgi:NAD(P)-dependent dehydrogenase (short-subunit alcohol dehydrogenase family)